MNDPRQSDTDTSDLIGVTQPLNVRPEHQAQPEPIPVEVVPGDPVPVEQVPGSGADGSDEPDDQAEGQEHQDRDDQPAEPAH